MQRVERLLARAREADPRSVDVAFAVVLGVAGSIEVLIVPIDSPVLPTLTAVVAGSATLAWRRSSPLGSATAFSAIAIAAAVVCESFLTQLGMPFAAIFVLLYGAGRYETKRRALAVAALLAAGPGAATATSVELGLDNILVWAPLLFAPPVLAGRAMASRVLTQEELRRRAREIEAGRAEEASMAAENERARIASELQAVVADGVSTMVVQAASAERMLERGDSSGARGSFEVIEATGRDALAEMRRLLGVLHRDGERASLAPQPSLALAKAIVDEASRDGIAVDLELEGRSIPLGPGLDLSASRVLQRALQGAVAAVGTSRVEVRIRYSEQAVEILVSDDRIPGAEPADSELVPIRERVHLYGGRTRTGSRPDGPGFAFEVSFPVESPRSLEGAGA